MLSELPVELVEAVIASLDWRDVLRIRKTCKALRDATKSLTVWRSMFFQLSDSYTVPICLPKPMAAYDPQELENFVLRWYKKEFIWDPAIPARDPSIRVVRYAAFSHFMLVEGGRWVLTSDRNDECSICAHLLDSSTSHSAALIPPKSDGSRVSAIHSYVDHNSSTLSFDLAVTFNCNHSESDFLGRRAEFWRVTEDVDKCQLSASPITAISTSLRTYGIVIYGVSLFGPWYAHFLGMKLIEVFDWTQSSESHHRKAVIKLPKSFEAYHLALLPGIHPKVMARGTRKISVFSIPDFLERACGNSNEPPPSDPVFSWEFRDEKMARVSEPSIHSNGDVYLTIATSRGYHLFHMSGDLISVSKLVGHASDHGDSVALGTHRAFRMTPRLADGGCTAVSFRGGPGGATTKEHRQPEKEWGRFFAMDEWSGRSVGELSNGDIIVHEFSP